MRRPLKYLKAHTVLFIGQVGNLGDTLPNGSKTIKGLRMELSSEGVHIFADNQAGQVQEALVPLANVQIAIFAEPDLEGTSKKAE